MDRNPLMARAALFALGAALTLPGTLLAQQARGGGPAQSEEPEDPRLAVLQAEDYLAPPQEVLDAVLATTIEDLRLSNLDPSGTFFMRTVGDGFPSLARFARKHYDLGQFMIDPVANRDRRMTTRGDVGIELHDRDGQLVRTIVVPDGARIGSASWSPDGSRIAFLANFDDATHIYLADPESGDSEQLTRTPLLATHVSNFEWTEDGQSIIAVLIPENRGPEPPAPEVPETPKVRMTTPERNSLRTYFDLLENPHEKQLVHYFSTGQLARIDVESGAVQTIGDPAMIEDIDPSPDGQFFRVTTMKEDLSYIVPVSSAGSTEEIWDGNGESLVMLDEDELNENVQGAGGGRGGRGGGGGAAGAADGKRGLSWRADGGPGMVYLNREEAEDEDEEDGPDRVMHWLPPFSETSTEVVYESESEIQNVDFDESGRILFLTREDGDMETLHAVFLDDPGQEYLIYEEDTEDEFDVQGSLMSERGAVRVSGNGQYVYLSGTQRFEDPETNAPRPFVDRVEIRTGEKERIFESSADMYEQVNTVLDDDFTEFIITRQSSTVVPNQWLLDLETGAETQLTFNEDHHPRITAARRETFMIRRPDGFQSRVNVTLPDDYQAGTQLPAMFWFYPTEYTDQDDYNEDLDNFNKNSFPNVGARSMEILTLLGYAVVEPDLPIVGPSGQQNDEYPHDLRNTLATVIDSLSKRGWVDRERLAIGGHSYGAFGTANAMIQTPFFKAGIAGDGNYNRSLTPAGFQRESRWLWEAQDLYVEMSPFFQADRLTGALLMYHGMDDHNVGTHPIHADRMFHALEVLGKTATMYKYPFEDHGPATRETTLDLWARWVAWLDLFVKNPGAMGEITTEDGPAGS